MADFTTVIDRDAQLTVHTVIGRITAQEVLDALRKYFAGVPTKNILWDLCEAGLNGVTPSEVKVIVDETRRYTHLRPGGRTAFFTCAEVAYGIGRMVDQAMNMADSPVEFMTFRDREAAMAWLGGSD